MSNPAACSVCGEREHKSRQCPELYKDLQPGFYKPAGGMPRGGDDEDELLNRTGLSPLFAVFVKNYTGCNGNIQRSKNSILTDTHSRCVKSL